MRISEVDSFRLEFFQPDNQRHIIYPQRGGITRIRTDEGLTGYGFQAVDAEPVRAMLVGEDPFQIERHLEAGLDRWYGAENALWDIVGKAAGLPLHKLLGTYREKIPLYVTCVWPGADDQTDVTPEQRAEDVVHYAECGYKAVKIRSWQADPMVDVEVLRLVRERVGGPDKLELMMDRTAHKSGRIWDYDTGLKVARALEGVGASWLEEPFGAREVPLHARLRAATDIAVTGGEGQPREIYQTYIKGEAFDIVQPHCGNFLGDLKKIAAMAELSGVQCIFHGSMFALELVGSLQIAATVRTCRMQEFVIWPVRSLESSGPPVLPEEMWSPLNGLVKGEEFFAVEEGCLKIPQAPGLGLELDEDALEQYRVPD